MYYIYLLRCNNQSLYCGYTTDLCRRISEHLFAKSGAKYTKRFKPISLAAAWEIESDLSQTMKIECAIKKLNKIEKENLIQHVDLKAILPSLEKGLQIQAIKKEILVTIWTEAIHQQEVEDCL